MHRLSFIQSIVLVIAALGSVAMAEEFSVVSYDAIPDGAYAVIAEVRAKPGKERELREATLPLVKKVRAEARNVVYFLHEDRAAPGHFTFYEIFPTKADFDAHNATSHVQAWFALLPELAAGNVTVTHMHLLGNKP